MTPEEIRALDGPGLTRLAWKLGLAPKDVHTIGHRILAYLTALTAPEKPWEPHRRIQQADAVFRLLRTRGWKTIVVGGSDVGEVFVERLADGAHVSVPWDTPDGEAYALLLASVLAMASTTPRPPHSDGSDCHCVWSTAGWFHHHGQPPPETADAAARLSAALGLDAEEGP